MTDSRRLDGPSRSDKTSLPDGSRHGWTDSPRKGGQVSTMYGTYDQFIFCHPESL